MINTSYLPEDAKRKHTPEYLAEHADHPVLPPTKSPLVSASDLRRFDASLGRNQLKSQLIQTYAPKTTKLSRNIGELCVSRLSHSTQWSRIYDIVGSCTVSLWSDI